MSRWGSIAVPAIIFIGSLLLVGAGVSYVTTDQSSNISTTTNQIVDDTLKEVSTL